MTTTGDCPKRDEKMNPVLYFAYGSNLDDAQMRERCANARVVGRATLPNYALVFGGFSHRWGGAVASVVRAKGACVEGLLYELGNVDLRELDRFEGHPFAYERVIRWVRDESGRRRRVMTYLQPEDGFEAWAPPLGYGHDFAPAHYVDAWLALTEPAGWTDADTRRLKSLFATYRR